jgi:hypothetical protein
MRLRWTEGAAADLQRITDRLYEENPASAPTVVRRIYHAPSGSRFSPQAAVEDGSAACVSW